MNVNIFTSMIGLTFDYIDAFNREQLLFYSGKKTFEFSHKQDCCECVEIEDICGELTDLVGSPMLIAEEVSDQPEPYDPTGDNVYSYTWTFYRFATKKGSVTVRWLGTSNGCYSEGVEFSEHEQV